MKKKLIDFILAQIHQGATPEGLAMTVALGVTVSLLPFMGVTTVICLIAGYYLSLNQPLLQLVNYAMTPLQLLMIPVYLKVGAWIFRAEEVPLNPKIIFEEFLNSPRHFMSEYAVATLHAVTAWAIFAPFLLFILYWCGKGLFRRFDLKN